MAIQQEKGYLGETLAAQYLLNKKYEIVFTNYRYKRSEIDIIAKDNNTLIFIEVKTRKSVKYGFPESFVDKKKAEKIIEGAEGYIFENDWKGNIRFDIVSIQLHSNQQYDIEHFQDAFY